MIETAGLQISPSQRHFGERGFRQDLSRDVIDRTTRDLVNEADVLVFARGNPGDDFTAGDFGIDDRLAPATAIVDHHDEILHECFRWVANNGRTISENQKLVKCEFRKTEICTARVAGPA